MPEIITIAEAKAQGLKWYFTGEPCKHGHFSERRTSNSVCIECSCEFNATPEARALKISAAKARRAKCYATPEARAAAISAANASHAKHRTKKLFSKLTDADAELKTWLDLEAKDQADRARKNVQKYRDKITKRLMKWEGQESVDAQHATWAAADAADEAAREAAAAEAAADDAIAAQERGEIPHRAAAPG